MAPILIETILLYEKSIRYVSVFFWMLICTLKEWDGFYSFIFVNQIEDRPLSTSNSFLF